MFFFNKKCLTIQFDFDHGKRSMLLGTMRVATMWRWSGRMVGILEEVEHADGYVRYESY